MGHGAICWGWEVHSERDAWWYCFHVQNVASCGGACLYVCVHDDHRTAWEGDC